MVFGVSAAAIVGLYFAKQFAGSWVVYLEQLRATFFVSALAAVLFAVVMLLTLLIFRTARSWVYYEGESR